jgi:hypothetical protein
MTLVLSAATAAFNLARAAAARQLLEWVFLLWARAAIVSGIDGSVIATVGARPRG